MTFFTASLFSVLNVYFNLSDNIFENLDKSGSSLSISAENIAVAEQKLSIVNGSFWGHKNSITRNAVLTNAQNKEFHTEQRIETDGNVQLFSYSGVAYIATDKYLQTYEQYSDYIQGNFPRQANEICLCNYIATELEVAVGDTIRIGADDFIVTAIYDETLLKGLPNYFVCVDDNFMFDDVNIELATSADTYRLYNKLLSKGIDVQIPAFYGVYIDGISATNGFILAISAAIFIANIIIVYAMFSMIVINRKKHICRMITLGASNATIFEVFYLLLFGIVTVVNIIDLINQAISENKMIRFQYFSYLPTKEKALKYDGMFYRFSPHRITWSNDSYYVIGLNYKYNNEVVYRIDRMTSLEIMDEEAKPVEEGFDMDSFLKSNFLMFDGELTRVTLKCDKGMMNSMSFILFSTFIASSIRQSMRIWVIFIWH